jgi:DNA-binding PadR family transcriptional regulator
MLITGGHRRTVKQSPVMKPTGTDNEYWPKRPEMKSQGVSSQKPSRGMPILYCYPTTTEFAPNKTALRIMKQLHGYFSATKKSWAHISQAWLMEQIEKYEKQPIGSSTLNYNLRILEDEGFIVRQKRHIRDNVTGQIVFRPSMYRITKKMRQFFSKIATYFKRAKWTPTIKQMEHGHVPVVGECTTREAVFKEFRQQVIQRTRGKT